MYVIDKIKEVPKIVWIVILVASIVLGIAIWRDLSSSRYEPVVINQKTEYYENKKGELYKASLAAILEVKNLKKQYDDLYDEYQKIKKDKPLVITHTITETKLDSVPLQTTLSADKRTMTWEWHKDISENNFIHLEGQTKIDSLMENATTLMKSLRIGSDLYVDFISNPDYPSTLQVVARSNNPYVNILDTKGTVVDPLSHPAFKTIMKKNEKKWSIGIQAGYGVSYDVSRKTVGSGPYIGIGITKRIIAF